jgi:hypothetical protein
VKVTDTMTDHDRNPCMNKSRPKPFGLKQEAMMLRVDISRPQYQRLGSQGNPR